MTSPPPSEGPLEGRLTWHFPRAFWIANSVELCERAAYYGTFIVLVVYLTRVVGLGDEMAGVVGAVFSGLIYFFPFMTGALADRIGFRAALILAFSLLAVGYGMLGSFDTLGPVLLALLLVALGGAFVKPVITGTVAKSSDETNRARAFSLFYMVVNIGSFIGKTVVKDIRVELGVDKVPYFSSGAALVALVVVLLAYRPPARGDERPRSVRETFRGMLKAMSNGRFLALILITAGFWAIQGQIYSAMPKYVLRLVGEQAKPEWLANVNPLVVVICVVFVTQLIRRWSSDVCIAIATGLIALSPLTMALSHGIEGPISILGIEAHPITVMMIAGIAIQGLAECFLSPKYLEYASRQAPPGQEGLYLGYAHLNVFFAWLSSFILAGFLLRWYCPDPKLLSPQEQLQRTAALAGEGPMPAAYSQAHYIWYAFAGIGIASLIALAIFIAVTRRIDSRRQGSAE